MSQTAYSSTPKVGKIGSLAESSKVIHARAKIASVAVPFGHMSVRDANDLKAKLPTSAAEVLAACKGSGGVAVASQAIVSSDSGIPQYPIGKEFAQLRQGPIFVLVEQDVTEGDQAFVRYANHVAAQSATYLAAEGGAADQKGAFRKDYDGTAQVDTLTPTANNADVYSVAIHDLDGKIIGSGSYIGDGSATAAEIVAGLKASLGTIADVVLSGTNTLIITAATAGKGFVTSVSANIAVANTTPNAASAAPAPGCYYKTSATVGTLAVLDVNLGGV